MGQEGRGKLRAPYPGKQQKGEHQRYRQPGTAHASKQQVPIVAP